MAQLPPRSNAKFAQDREVPGKKENEGTETPPEERNPPDLAWPRVVHSEAVPPPWKRSVSPSVSPGNPTTSLIESPKPPARPSPEKQVPPRHDPDVPSDRALQCSRTGTNRGERGTNPRCGEM